MKLYTFGYNGGAWDALKGVLQAPNAVLCDVRFSPWGRPGTGRSDFQARYGRQYVHVPALGNRNYKGGPIELANEKAGVQQVVKMLLQGRPVVLMCACADPAVCHRTVAARKVLEAMVAQGQQVEIEDLKAAATPKPPDSQLRLF